MGAAGRLGVFDESGREVFSQNIGMRIAGSFGRGRAQKGFNLIARDAYGDNRMAYPFFEDLDYTEYKSIVLRAGAQDQNSGKFRDELAAGLLVGSDVNFLYQAYKPYVLYLNGEYWGVYFMKEKRNRFFVAQHEGTDDTVNMDIIRSAGKGSVYYGSNAEWQEFMTWLNGTGNDLSSASNYAYAEERVDLDSFMDYMICEIYSAIPMFGTSSITRSRAASGNGFTMIFAGASAQARTAPIIKPFPSAGCPASPAPTCSTHF